MAARTNKRDPRAARTLRRISFVREVKQSFLIIWVVFDKDDFPDRDFNRAIGMAEAGGMRVAYSNQAFEYWFLLHYNLVQGPMHRNQYETKLSGLLGFSYNKEAGTGGRVFRELGGKQAQAITNAKAVLRRMEGIPPAQAESSTTVHLLVEELNKYI